MRHARSRRAPWCVSGLAGILCATASAQIVVNEVLYDPAGPDAGNEIIEIANLRAGAQNLGSWALCLGFSAPFSRVYWSFPIGTSIPAGGFIRVHWMTNGPNTPTDLFTGTASGNFTCFFGNNILKGI